MPASARELIAERGRPVTIDPGTSLATAVDLMITNDYSQLPVVDPADRVLGIVTTDSILRAQVYFGSILASLRAADALMTSVVRPLDHELRDLLDDLRDDAVVLIVDNEECLKGIVTHYDASVYLRRQVEDMLLVQDIETTVRELVRWAFPGAYGEADLQAAVHARWPDRTFDKLTFFQYAELFLDESRWDTYKEAFPLDPQLIRHLLKDARETRNELAHFRREVTAKERDQLLFCRNWLQRHKPVHPNGAGVYEALEGVEPPPEPESAANEELRSDDSRYATLGLYLQGQSPGTDRIELTFEAVAKIVGGPLPSSAYQHRSWWDNDYHDHVQSREWLGAGWRVWTVDLTGQEVTFARIREREHAYRAFFDALLADMDAVGEATGVAPSQGWNWWTVGRLPAAGPLCGSLVFTFTRPSRFRVELYIDAYDRDGNKRIFDHLHDHREDIESELGERLTWERLDHRNASRVALYHAGSVLAPAEELEALRRWALEALIRFKAALASHLPPDPSGSM